MNALSLEANSGAYRVRQLVLCFVPLPVFYVASAFLGLSGLHYLLGLPAVLVLSYRQFFIAHDCAHRTFFESTRANIALGKITTAFLFTPFHYFEGQHLLHHRHLGTASDPGFIDYQPNVSRRPDLVWHFAKPFLGLTVLKSVRGYLQGLMRRRTFSDFTGRRLASRSADSLRLLRDWSPVLVVQGAQALVSWGVSEAGLIHYLLYGVYPSIFGFLGLSRIRMFAEHHGSSSGSKVEAEITRDFAPNVIERVLLTANSFEYHRIHHRTPRTRSSHLRDASKVCLSGGGFQPSGFAPATDSYTRAIRSAWRELRYRGSNQT